MNQTIHNFDEGFVERYIEAQRRHNERLKKSINDGFYALLRAHRSEGLSTGAAAQAAVDGLNKALQT